MKRKKRRLKRWVKVVLAILLILIIWLLIGNQKTTIKKETKESKNVIKETKKILTKEIVEIPEEDQEEQEETSQYNVESTQKTEKNNNEIENIVESSYTTRMTSYYTNDGYETGSCTGSGLCAKDFQVNDKGWFTYQGKLVVATATTYLLKEGFSLADGVHTYKYYDEITLNIDGVDYQAVVLDSCGSSMKTDRIDLFVNSASNVKDAMISVNY